MTGQLTEMQIEEIRRRSEAISLQQDHADQVVLVAMADMSHN